MKVVEWIGKRVGQPGASETFLARKILSIGMVYGGCALTLISALMHRSVGFTLDGRYNFARRDPIYVKGKGKMVTYLLEI